MTTASANSELGPRANRRLPAGCDYPFSTGTPSRDDFAEYIFANLHIVRRRLRSRLRGTGDVLLECDDMVSSTIRRLDLALLRGLLRPRSERELWAYILAVTDSVVVRRLRTLRRARAALGRDLANTPAPRGREDWRSEHARELHDLLMSLDDDTDRELLYWRLRDRKSRQIAGALGLSDAAVRQRWSRICRRARLLGRPS